MTSFEAVNDCPKGTLCHYLDNEPTCTDKLIGMGVTCPGNDCICELSKPGGVTLQKMIENGQRCEEIQDKIKVVDSVIRPSATCKSDKCACVENDQKWGVICVTNQVCAKERGITSRSFASPKPSRKTKFAKTT